MGQICPIGSTDGSRTLSAAAAAAAAVAAVAAAMFIHEIYLIVSVKFMMTGAYGRSPYNKTHSDHCCFLNQSGRGEKTRCQFRFCTNITNRTNKSVEMIFRVPK